MRKLLLISTLTLLLYSCTDKQDQQTDPNAEKNVSSDTTVKTSCSYLTNLTYKTVSMNNL